MSEQVKLLKELVEAIEALHAAKNDQAKEIRKEELGWTADEAFKANLISGAFADELLALTTPADRFA